MPRVPKDVKNYCANTYTETYVNEKNRLTESAIANSRSGQVSEAAEKKIEKTAQKEAIKNTLICGLRTYRDVEAALIWRAVYETHVNRKSGVDDAVIIANVISADQSWKKSSGQLKCSVHPCCQSTGLR